MPGGNRNIKGTDGNTFTTENQPENRGRKKGSRNVSTMLRLLLIEKDKIEGGTGDYGNPLAAELIRIAFAKDDKGKFLHSEQTRLRALEKAIDRIDGKDTQPIKHEGEPITKIVLERVIRKSGDS